MSDLLHLLWIRVTALVTVFAFSVTTLAWSAPELDFSRFQHPDVPFPSLLDRIQIPDTLASIKEEFASSLLSAPVIVHIQDAHAHREAQNHIQAILKHLAKEYGFSLVLLEGAASRLDGDFLRFTRDDTLNRTIVGKLMDQGELSGAEALLFEKALQDPRSRIQDAGSKIQLPSRRYRNSGNPSEKQGGRSGRARGRASATSLFEDFAPFQKASPPSVASSGPLHSLPGSWILDLESRFQVFGVESLRLYRSNLRRFRRILKREEALEPFFDELKLWLSKAGSHLLNPRLRRFLKEWMLYQDSRREILSHLTVLEKEAMQVKNLNLHDAKEQLEWPQLIRFFKIRDLEKKLDLKKANEEKHMLVHWAQKQRIPSQLIQPIVHLFDPSTTSAIPSPPSGRRGLRVRGQKERVSDVKDLRSVLEQFHEKARPKGFTFKDYPAFTQYAGFLILKNEMESEALFGEIQRLSGLLLDELTEKDEEKTFVQILKDYLLLKKLFTLELTRSEYDEIRQRPQDFLPSRFLQRIESVLPPILPSSPQPLPGQPGSGWGEEGTFDSLFRDSLTFYKEAKVREEKMVQNALALMKEKKQDKAILIAGGFHSDGMKSLLREKNLSYLEVTPKITQLQDREVYLKSILPPSSAIPDFRKAQSLADMETLMGRPEVVSYLRQVSQIAQESAKRSAVVFDGPFSDANQSLGQILHSLPEPRPLFPKVSKPTTRAELRLVRGPEEEPLKEWRTKAQGIQNLREALPRNRPHILDRYEGLPPLTETQREALRNEIYRITSGHFHVWGLGGALDQKAAPYFGGSYIQALQVVFSDPRLGLRREGFQERAELRKVRWDRFFLSIPIVFGALYVASSFFLQAFWARIAFAASVALGYAAGIGLALWLKSHPAKASHGEERKREILDRFGEGRLVQVEYKIKEERPIGLGQIVASLLQREEILPRQVLLILVGDEIVYDWEEDRSTDIVHASRIVNRSLDPETFPQPGERITILARKPRLPPTSLAGGRAELRVEKDGKDTAKKRTFRSRRKFLVIMLGTVAVAAVGFLIARGRRLLRRWKPQITYFAIAHATAQDMRRHTANLDEARREAEHRNKKFVVLTDFGGPSFPTTEMPPDQVVKIARENPQAKEILREYFDSNTKKFLRWFEQAEKGEVPDLDPDTPEWLRELLQWAARTRTRVILQDLDFGDWMDYQSAGYRLKEAYQRFVRPGLPKEEERRRIYFQTVEKTVQDLAKIFSKRNGEIVDQAVVETEKGNSVGLLYGAVHFGIFEALRDRRQNVARAASSGDERNTVFWSGIEGLAKRIASGEKLEQAAREEIYERQVVLQELAALATERGEEDTLQILQVAGKIESRWTHEETMELTRRIRRPLAGKKQSREYLEDWLRKNATAEEKEFFKPRAELRAPSPRGSEGELLEKIRSALKEEFLKRTHLKSIEITDELVNYLLGYLLGHFGQNPNDEAIQKAAQDLAVILNVKIRHKKRKKAKFTAESVQDWARKTIRTWRRFPPSDPSQEKPPRDERAELRSRPSARTDEEWRSLFKEVRSRHEGTLAVYRVGGYKRNYRLSETGPGIPQRLLLQEPNLKLIAQIPRPTQKGQRVVTLKFFEEGENPNRQLILPGYLAGREIHLTFDRGRLEKIYVPALKDSEGKVLDAAFDIPVQRRPDGSLFTGKMGYELVKQRLIEKNRAAHEGHLLLRRTKSRYYEIVGFEGNYLSATEVAGEADVQLRAKFGKWGTKTPGAYFRYLAPLEGGEKLESIVTLGAEWIGEEGEVYLDHGRVREIVFPESPKHPKVTYKVTTLPDNRIRTERVTEEEAYWARLFDRVRSQHQGELVVWREKGKRGPYYLASTRKKVPQRILLNEPRVKIVTHVAPAREGRTKVGKFHILEKGLTRYQRLILPAYFIGREIHLIFDQGKLQTLYLPTILGRYGEIREEEFEIPVRRQPNGSLGRRQGFDLAQQYVIVQNRSRHKGYLLLRRLGTHIYEIVGFEAHRLTRAEVALEKNVKVIAKFSKHKEWKAAFLFGTVTPQGERIHEVIPVEGEWRNQLGEVRMHYGRVRGIVFQATPERPLVQYRVSRDPRGRIQVRRLTPKPFIVRETGRYYWIQSEGGMRGIRPEDFPPNQEVVVLSEVRAGRGARGLLSFGSSRIHLDQRFRERPAHLYVREGRIVRAILPAIYDALGQLRSPEVRVFLTKDPQGRWIAKVDDREDLELHFEKSRVRNEGYLRVTRKRSTYSIRGTNISIPWSVLSLEPSVEFEFRLLQGGRLTFGSYRLHLRSAWRRGVAYADSGTIRKIVLAAEGEKPEIELDLVETPEEILIRERVGGEITRLWIVEKKALKEELVEEIGVRPQEREPGRGRSLIISLSQTVRGTEDPPILGTIPAARPTPQEILIAREAPKNVTEELRKYFDGDEVTLNVLLASFVNEWPIEEIGRQLNLDLSKVSEIRKRGVEKLQRFYEELQSRADLRRPLPDPARPAGGRQAGADAVWRAELRTTDFENNQLTDIMRTVNRILTGYRRAHLPRGKPIGVREMRKLLEPLIRFRERLEGYQFFQLFDPQKIRDPEKRRFGELLLQIYIQQEGKAVSRITLETQIALSELLDMDLGQILSQGTRAEPRGGRGTAVSDPALELINDLKSDGITTRRRAASKLRHLEVMGKSQGRIATQGEIHRAELRSSVRETLGRGELKRRLAKVLVGTGVAGGTIVALYLTGVLDSYLAVKGAIPPRSWVYWPAAILDMVTGVLVWGTSDAVGQYLNQGSIRKRQSLIVGSGGTFQGLATHILLNIPDFLPVLPWAFGQKLFRTVVVLVGGTLITIVFARLTSLTRKLLKVEGYAEPKEIRKTLDVILSKLVFAPPKTFAVINILPVAIRVVTEQIWDYLMTIWSSYLMNREDALFLRYLPKSVEAFLHRYEKPSSPSRAELRDKWNLFSDEWDQLAGLKRIIAQAHALMDEYGREGDGGRLTGVMAASALIKKRLELLEARAPHVSGDRKAFEGHLETHRTNYEALKERLDQAVRARTVAKVFLTYILGGAIVGLPIYFATGGNVRAAALGILIGGLLANPVRILAEWLYRRLRTPRDSAPATPEASDRDETKEGGKRAELRHNLFYDARVSARDKKMILSLIPPPLFKVLEKEGYPQKELVWVAEKLPGRPMEKRRPWYEERLYLVVLKKENGRLTFSLTPNPSRLWDPLAGIREEFAHIDLKADGKRLWIYGGWLESFPEAVGSSSDPKADTFHWWFQNLVLPFAQELGFEEIAIRQEPLSTKALKGLGFERRGRHMGLPLWIFNRFPARVLDEEYRRIQDQVTTGWKPTPVRTEDVTLKFGGDEGVTLTFGPVLHGKVGGGSTRPLIQGTFEYRAVVDLIDQRNTLIVGYDRALSKPQGSKPGSIYIYLGRDRQGRKEPGWYVRLKRSEGKNLYSPEEMRAHPVVALFEKAVLRHYYDDSARRIDFIEEAIQKGDITAPRSGPSPLYYAQQDFQLALPDLRPQYNKRWIGLQWYRVGHQRMGPAAFVLNPQFGLSRPASEERYLFLVPMGQWVALYNERGFIKEFPYGTYLGLDDDPDILGFFERARSETKRAELRMLKEPERTILYATLGEDLSDLYKKYFYGGGKLSSEIVLRLKGAPTHPAALEIVRNPNSPHEVIATVAKTRDIYRTLLKRFKVESIGFYFDKDIVVSHRDLDEFQQVFLEFFDSLADRSYGFPLLRRFNIHTLAQSHDAPHRHRILFRSDPNRVSQTPDKEVLQGALHRALVDTLSPYGGMSQTLQFPPFILRLLESGILALFEILGPQNEPSLNYSQAYPIIQTMMKLFDIRPIDLRSDRAKSVTAEGKLDFIRIYFELFDLLAQGRSRISLIGKYNIEDVDLSNTAPYDIFVSFKRADLRLPTGKAGVTEERGSEFLQARSRLEQEMFEIEGLSRYDAPSTFDPSGRRIGIYFPTPFPHLDEGGMAIQIGPHDTVLELGAGSLRVSAYSAGLLGATTVAYEHSPVLFQKSLEVKKRLSELPNPPPGLNLDAIKRIEVRNEDFFTVLRDPERLRPFTVIHYFGLASAAEADIGPLLAQNMSEDAIVWVTDLYPRDPENRVKFEKHLQEVTEDYIQGEAPSNRFFIHPKADRNRVKALRLYRAQVGMNPRVAELLSAMEEFKQLEAAQGREMPMFTENGTFDQSTPEMLEDLVKQFHLGSRKRILEGGGGNRLAALILAELSGADITSIEVDEDRLAFGERFQNYLETQKGIRYPNVHFIRGDLLKHPFAGYDLIYFYYTFPPKARETFLRELLLKVENELQEGSVFVSPLFGLLPTEETILEEFFDSGTLLDWHTIDLAGDIYTGILTKSPLGRGDDRSAPDAVWRAELRVQAMDQWDEATFAEKVLQGDTRLALSVLEYLARKFDLYGIPEERRSDRYREDPDLPEFNANLERFLNTDGLYSSREERHQTLDRLIEKLWRTDAFYQWQKTRIPGKLSYGSLWPVLDHALRYPDWIPLRSYVMGHEEKRRAAVATLYTTLLDQARELGMETPPKDIRSSVELAVIHFDLSKYEVIPKRMEIHGFFGGDLVFRNPLSNKSIYVDPRKRDQLTGTILGFIRFLNGDELELHVSRAAAEPAFKDYYWSGWGVSGMWQKDYDIYRRFIHPLVNEILRPILRKRPQNEETVILDIFAGDGTLARLILETAMEDNPGHRIRYHLIERNETLVRRARENLPGLQAVVHQGDLTTLANITGVTSVPPHIVISSGGINRRVVDFKEATDVAKKIYESLPEGGLFIVTGATYAYHNSDRFRDLGFEVLNYSVPVNIVNTLKGQIFSSAAILENIPAHFYILRKPVGTRAELRTGTKGVEPASLRQIWHQSLEEVFSKPNALDVFQRFLKGLPPEMLPDFTNFFLYYVFEAYRKEFGPPSVKVWPRQFPKRGKVLETYQVFLKSNREEGRRLATILQHKGAIEEALADIDRLMRLKRRPWQFFNLTGQGAKIAQHLRTGWLDYMRSVIEDQYHKALSQVFNPAVLLEGRLEKISRAAQNFSMLLQVIVALQADRLELIEGPKELKDGAGKLRYYQLPWKRQVYRVQVLTRWRGVKGAPARFGIRVLDPREESSEGKSLEITSLDLDYTPERLGLEAVLDLPESFRALVTRPEGKYHLALHALREAHTFSNYIQALDAQLESLDPKSPSRKTRAELRGIKDSSEPRRGSQPPSGKWNLRGVQRTSDTGDRHVPPRYLGSPGFSTPTGRDAAGFGQGNELIYRLSSGSGNVGLGKTPGSSRRQKSSRAKGLKEPSDRAVAQHAPPFSVSAGPFFHSLPTVRPPIRLLEVKGDSGFKKERKTHNLPHLRGRKLPENSTHTLWNLGDGLHDKIKNNISDSLWQPPALGTIRPRADIRRPADGVWRQLVRPRLAAWSPGTARSARRAELRTAAPPSLPPHIYRVTDQIYVVRDEMMFSNIIGRRREIPDIAYGESIPASITDDYVRGVRATIQAQGYRARIEATLISLYMRLRMIFIGLSQLQQGLHRAARVASHERIHHLIKKLAPDDQRVLRDFWDLLRNASSRAARGLLAPIQQELASAPLPPARHWEEIAALFAGYRRGILREFFLGLRLDWESQRLDQETVLGILSRLKWQSRLSRVEQRALRRTYQQIVNRSELRKTSVTAEKTKTARPISRPSGSNTRSQNRGSSSRESNLKLAQISISVNDDGRLSSAKDQPTETAPPRFELGSPLSREASSIQLSYGAAQGEDSRIFEYSQYEIDEKEISPTPLTSLERWARVIARASIDSVVEVARYPAQRVIGESAAPEVKLALYRILFPEAYTREERARGLTHEEVKALEEAGISRETTDFIQQIFSVDDQTFSIISVPVSGEISLSELKQILTELEPVLLRQAHKPLVLAYEGPAPFSEAFDVYETFHERAFLFGNVQDYPRFIEALLRPDYKRLSEHSTDRILVELFHAKAKELYRTSGSKENFTSLERLHRTQVVGSPNDFAGLLDQVARRFLRDAGKVAGKVAVLPAGRQVTKGVATKLQRSADALWRDSPLSGADGVRAEILFNVISAGLANAELIRKMVGEVLRIETRDRDGKRIDLSFNPNQLTAIQQAVQAIKALSKLRQAA